MQKRIHLFAVVAVLIGAASALADVSPIAIKVAENTTTKRDGNKVNRETALKVSVKNLTPNDLGILQARYFLFIKDLKSEKPTLDEVGSKRVTLAAMGNDEFEPKNVTADYTPLEYKKDKHGKMTPVPASGQKYAGYVIQIRHGGKLLAQSISTELEGRVDVATLDGAFAAWQKKQAEKEKPPPPKKK